MEYESNEEKSTTVLEDSGIFILSSEIDCDVAKEVVTWILESNLKKDRSYETLTLIINSPGGELTDAFAIIDTMNGSDIPVYTVGLGQICSAGLLIFINGAYRVLTPNTCIMCHHYSWWLGGTHSELVSARKEQDLMEYRMIRHIKRCTGISKAGIKKNLLKESDVYLDSKEAINFGLCEEVKELRK